ncbi:virulence factors transcription regulator [Xenorhabdus mauleonii]|uniref:Regulatory protein, luxR family n=1 Tax=Xenorhabdus mauleonii TaxID=351675 RepID=A0A1I3QC39_9GAMM|nr:PAS and helix-turn-helix domain-containing protein [Xenorhabdus mauleonii]PHM40023.1 virulence factors transcription regulator [Xenorhabdus mauleonii]SFJ31102.1 regulatory protein, luxR family [Xenorhabdus mauleonii]
MNQITPQLTTMWDKSHDSWFIKDKKHRFIYANKVFLKLSNLPENFDITGCTTSTLPTSYSHLAHLFEEHDRNVLQFMQRISSIGTYFQSNNAQIRPYSCEKYPLMDENHQCIGVIGHIKEINHFSVHHYINNNKSISVNITPPNNSLAEKEWLIIFLFCRGISNKGIADEMKISVRTLEKYFKNIYEKLSINSIFELKMLCEENNYDLYIPPNYFKYIDHYFLQKNNLELQSDDNLPCITTEESAWPQ